MQLYSEQCIEQIRSSHTLLAELEKRLGVVESRKGRYDSSSDEERPSDQHSSDASSTSGSDSDSRVPRSVVSQHRATNRGLTARLFESKVQKQVDLLTHFRFDFASSNGIIKSMNIASGLLRKEQKAEPISRIVSSYLELATLMEFHPVVVISLRSGRFAGAVFQKDCCVGHKTIQKYTVRRGQGKAQSSQDGQRKARSMGAQLRRNGEVELQAELRDVLRCWKTHLQDSCLILVSCPKPLRRSLFVGLEDVVDPRDARLRYVPLDTNRPSFDNIKCVHTAMLRVTIEDKEEADNVIEKEEVGTLEPSVATTVNNTGEDQNAFIHHDVSPSQAEFQLTDLHIAARTGDCDMLLQRLEHDMAFVNQVTGPDLLTPLHLAAASTSSGVDVVKAAKCVKLLLEVGRADPCIRDARDRLPYFLAQNEKIREAFRVARYALGEDFCSWDSRARVGAPLSPEEIQTRKDKELEKRRRKNRNRKERRAKDKVANAPLDHDSLESPAPGLAVRQLDNICDFCSKGCQRKSRMFSRLQYWYCSADCVQKHKRELICNAALKRVDRE